MTNTGAYGKCSVAIMEHASHVRRDAAACVRACTCEGVSCVPTDSPSRVRVAGGSGGSSPSPLTRVCFRSAVIISSIKDKALLNIIEHPCPLCGESQELVIPRVPPGKSITR